MSLFRPGEEEQMYERARTTNDAQAMRAEFDRGMQDAFDYIKVCRKIIDIIDSRTKAASWEEL